jgi:hypothetical protein
MKQRSSITFNDSDTGAYDKLLRLWEDHQPKAPDEIGRIWMRPSLGQAGVGRTVAVPVEPGLVEFLKAEDFPFTLQASGA